MSMTLCYINVDFNHFHLFASLVVVRMSRPVRSKVSEKCTCSSSNPKVQW